MINKSAEMSLIKWLNYFLLYMKLIINWLLSKDKPLCILDLIFHFNTLLTANTLLFEKSLNLEAHSQSSTVQATQVWSLSQLIKSRLLS